MAGGAGAGGSRLVAGGRACGSCVCCGTRGCRRPEAPAGHQPGRHRACLWRCSRQGEFSGRRGSTPRLPAAASKKATIWAPRRRRGRGYRAGMPPSLDLARSAPCPHDPTRPSDAAARSDSAVYLSAGSQIVAQQVLLSTTLLDPRSARRSVYLCLLFALLQVEELHGGPKRL